MKNMVRILGVAIAGLAVSCDPGMTIRQAKAPDEAVSGISAGGAQVAIDVKTSHPIIGETWYAPQVRITNSSDSSITIINVDLTARGTTYTNKPPQPGCYPLAVQPGKTEALLVWFDLNESVKKSFYKQPAELRVYYRKDNKEWIAHTSVVGGPLNTATP
jgi:hypothetical protein